VVVGQDADATPFLALNHGQRLDCYFHSMCSLAWSRRGCRRGHCLRSLLLPCLLGQHLRNSLSAPFVALDATRSDPGL
jgi:hypothetical protein